MLQSPPLRPISISSGCSNTAVELNHLLSSSESNGPEVLPGEIGAPDFEPWGGSETLQTPAGRGVGSPLAVRAARTRTEADDSDRSR